MELCSACADMSLDLNDSKFTGQMLFDRDFFFLPPACWKYKFSVKRNLTASLPTQLKKKKEKKNLNTVVEIRFHTHKYVLILNKFRICSNILSGSVLPWQKSILQPSFSMLKRTQNILITGTGGQAWLLHHRRFNQYQPEHFIKKRLELKSISLLKEKNGCKTTRTAGKSCNVPRTQWGKIRFHERNG